MENNHKLISSRLSTPARDFATDNIWQGWDDYRNGRGWNPSYDVWPPIQQKRYEVGRGYAAIVAAHIGAVPKWPRNRLLNLKACGDAASIVQHECNAEGDFYREGPLDIATAVTPKSGEQDATVAEDVNLLRNDWRSNKNGNDYIQRLAVSRRPDVLEYVTNVLAPRVEAVDKEFAQKHGLQTDPNIESAIRNAHIQGQPSQQVAPAAPQQASQMI